MRSGNREKRIAKNREYHRKWRAKNREKWAEYGRQWRINNPEKNKESIRKSNAKRRSR